MCWLLCSFSEWLIHWALLTHFLIGGVNRAWNSMCGLMRKDTEKIRWMLQEAEKPRSFLGSARNNVSLPIYLLLLIGGGISPNKINMGIFFRLCWRSKPASFLFLFSSPSLSYLKENWYFKFQSAQSIYVALQICWVQPGVRKQVSICVCWQWFHIV